MIGLLRYPIMVFILHQWILFASPTPSGSSQDLADILSVPSGNIRPGMLSSNHYNEMDEDTSQQDDILDNIENKENTSVGMDQSFKDNSKKQQLQDRKRIGLVGGSGWINDTENYHLLNILHKLDNNL